MSWPLRSLCPPSNSDILGDHRERIAKSKPGCTCRRRHTRRDDRQRTAVYAPGARPDTSSERSTAPARMRKASTVTGLTGREYHVLIILNCYGWCTPEMVRCIANFHGVPWTSEGKRVYLLLSRLKKLGFVVSRRLFDTTNTIAYAATQNGIAYIRGTGDDLLCDTNAIKDPASLFHFVGLNRIMLKFVSQFSTRYWLSDFQVRSDNSFIGANGLAKDYDSVGELVLPTGHVRFAVEYERWQQSSRRYSKLCACLSSEKYLHMVHLLSRQARTAQVCSSTFQEHGRIRLLY